MAESNEPSIEPKPGIPIADAIELLRSIENAPLYRGKSAQEIVELKKLSISDWKSVWNEYFEWATSMHSGPNWLWAVAFIAAVVAYWYAHIVWFIAALIWPVYVLARRAGEKEGYGCGYEAGFARGVNRALGLSDEEAVEISQRAIDAEIWNHIDVDRLREKQRKDPSHS